VLAEGGPTDRRFAHRFCCKLPGTMMVDGCGCRPTISVLLALFCTLHSRLVDGRVADLGAPIVDIRVEASRWDHSDDGSDTIDEEEEVSDVLNATRHHQASEPEEADADANSMSNDSAAVDTSDGGKISSATTPLMATTTLGKQVVPGENNATSTATTTTTTYTLPPNATTTMISTTTTYTRVIRGRIGKLRDTARSTTAEVAVTSVVRTTTTTRPTTSTTYTKPPPQADRRAHADSVTRGAHAAGAPTDASREPAAPRGLRWLRR